MRDTCNDDIAAATPLLFPMYTVPLEDVLKMRAVRPHEELRQLRLKGFSSCMMLAWKPGFRVTPVDRGPAP